MQSRKENYHYKDQEIVTRQCQYTAVKNSFVQTARKGSWYQSFSEYISSREGFRRD